MKLFFGDISKFCDYLSFANESPRRTPSTFVLSITYCILLNNRVQVVYTYDVKWEKSDVKWSNRWDIYLRGNPDDEIHYFSIVNSLMIVLFLTGVVAMIMLRTLRKDIASYNEMQTLEEAQEESGWKLVHGDVFRPPTFSPMLLSVLAGTAREPPLHSSVTCH